MERVYIEGVPDWTLFKMRCFILFIGLGLFFTSEHFLKRNYLSFLNKPIFTNIALSLMFFFLPLFLLEFTFRPMAVSYASSGTSIFMRDKELGWKLRPDAQDYWGYVKIKINAKGIRGPELDYSKPSNVKRILYLGDSVTFGYRIENDLDTFPYKIESFLEKKFPSEIETVNSGVGGYSPWQEFIYLKNEGIRYSPDLVVLSFVLNDLDEKFKVVPQFGGKTEAFQVKSMQPSFDPGLADRLKESGVFFLAKQIGVMIRFGVGKDIQQEALKREIDRVEYAVNHSENPEVKNAWNITLKNIKEIFDFCKNRKIPIMVIIFPFTDQFEKVHSVYAEHKTSPQKIVSDFSHKNLVPVLDLLPVLSEELKKRGMKPDDFFLDKAHLTPLGCDVVGEIVVDFLSGNNLI